MRILSLIFLTFIFFGCAPKIVELSTLNPKINPIKTPNISVYDVPNERIVFYTFSQKEGVLMQTSWAKMLPFRVEFLDMWVSGLGHDLRRLSQNHAETIPDTLMYHAKQQGLISLHVNTQEYLLESSFAQEMVHVIEQYEEKMKRYERNREFPFLLRTLRP